ncbi:MAG: translation initiation factor IF-2 [Planctomycetes bacterium]|nr:translation initiation factor IF-2 [Planctomycetota bacterium]
MRLHELAKKLGVSSKEIMAACEKQGIEAKSHFRAATPDIIFAMNKVFGGTRSKKIEVEPKAAPAKKDIAKPKETKAKTATPTREKKAKPPKPSAAPKPQKKSPARPKAVPLPTDKSPHKDKTPVELPHVEHRAHKHKRANFRGKSPSVTLPAEPEISNRYESMIYPTRPPSRRRRSRRKKPNAAMLAARAAQQVQARPQATGPSKTSLRKREQTPENVVELMPPVTPRDLSAALGVKLNDIIRFCMNENIMVNINAPLLEETVEIIALDQGKEVKFLRPRDFEQEIEDSFKKMAEDESEQVKRPPVIAFLGHVDHGKTSLLDFIRKSRVVDTESGGITQHIGAYRVQTKRGMLCFLDTPGHQAFSTMRARGANLTDIVVLVVAADDGVMPQTREAYAHAKAAGVPVVVAINKCDLPNANPQRALQELASVDEGLLPEVWGGTTGMIQCSAETGDGIEELLERIELEAEMLELKATPTHPAEGHVLEAKLTQDRGVVANVLIQEGTLRCGQVGLAGAGYGKIKLMFNENGQTITEAGPATPVSITGLSTVPEAGDKFFVVSDLNKAREVARKRDTLARAERLSMRRHVSLDNLSEYLKESQTTELCVVLKADVAGTLEVLRKTLDELSTDEVTIHIIHSGVGGINQADIILADASDALVVGFHVIADPVARSHAEKRKVEVKIYHVIYRLIEDMKAALSGLLPPEQREIIQGHVEVRQLFKVSRLGNIAGCMVTDGIVTRTSRMRVFRDNIMIHDGRIESLQRFKDQVREVREGFDCGIRLKGYDSLEVGDTFEAYIIEEVARTLA